jgi:hypothetical protein
LKSSVGRDTLLPWLTGRSPSCPTVRSTRRA